jgi:tripartite-type tricarboxylate transporter receptor subunit TctC
MTNFSKLCLRSPALLLLSGLMPLNDAVAADYPVKPVRIIVPSVAGAGLDTLTRLVAQKLTERSGKPFVIDNRPGAGGAIGMEMAARAVPDGYTLVMFSGTQLAANTIPKKQAFDTLKDFSPVAWATSQPYVLNVHPSLPVKSVPELIKLAKAKPGAINFGSSGTGGIQHLSGVTLISLSGANFFHVPYKGGAQVVNDLLAGQIQMSFTVYPVCKPLIESGRMRALGVTTAKRAPALPNMPAIAETLPGYDINNWYGMVGAAKIPVPIMEWLHREINASLQQTEVKRTLTADAIEVVSVSRQEFGKHLASEVSKWGRIIQQSGITD